MRSINHVFMKTSKTEPPTEAGASARTADLPAKQRLNANDYIGEGPA
jgi:hypothetical protein